LPPSPLPFPSSTPRSEGQLYHYLWLNNNNLWTEVPGFMLEAIALPGASRRGACLFPLPAVWGEQIEPALHARPAASDAPACTDAPSPRPMAPHALPARAAEKNPCRCQAWIDLSNNTRFCPTRATVEGLAPGVLELLVTDSVIDSTCLRSDFSVVQLRDYLADPQNYVTSIPPPPPLKHPSGSSGSSGAGGGGGSSSGGGGNPASGPVPAGGYSAPYYPGRRGGGGGLNAGAAAGIAIGVVVAVAVLGGLVWFVVRPIWQERRATSFFRTKDLDGDGLPVLAAPPPAAGPPGAGLSHSASDQAMAAFEAGWGRYAQGGPGSGGGGGRYPMRSGSAV
jgi:hypothetical protein